MPDENTLPNPDNLKDWRFGHMTGALTGKLYDLQKLAKADWLTLKDKPAEDGTFYTYTHSGEFVFSVDVTAGDNSGYAAWNAAVADIDSIMADFPGGVVGDLNRPTVVDAAGSIFSYQLWLSAIYAELESWANSLDSKDSDFKGKAAYLIQAALGQKRDAFNDLLQQMQMYGSGAYGETKAAADALEAVGRSMPSYWDAYKSTCASLEQQFNIERYEIWYFLQAYGCDGSKPNYLGRGGLKKDFYQPVPGGAVWVKTGADFKPDEARKILAHFSSKRGNITVQGDLCKADVWKQISSRISTLMSADLDKLDNAFRQSFGDLTTQYRLTAAALLPLVAPAKPPNIVFTPDPVDNPNDSLNNFGDLGNLNNFGDLGNLNNYGGLSDFGSNLNNLGGGLSDFGSNLNNLGGGLSNFGGIGNLNNAGGGLSDFGGIGNLNNVGGGLSDFGSGTGAGGLGAGLAGTAGLAGLAGLAGAGGAAGLAGLRSSAGGGLGSASVKRDSLLNSQTGQGLASSVLDESAAASKGLGGVPFYPPSMGGGMGGMGDQPKERERLTWLTEDEDVWGTSVNIGPNVVGRHDTDPDEADEIAVLPGLLPSYPGRGRHKSRSRDTTRRQRIARGTVDQPLGGQPTAAASEISDRAQVSDAEPVTTEQASKPPVREAPATAGESG